MKRSKPRVSRVLLWAFVFSLFVHFAGGPLLLWLFRSSAMERPQQIVERISFTRSSALRFERRPQPRTARRLTIEPPHAESVRSVPVPARAAQRPPPPRELARIIPRARVSVPRFAPRHADSTSIVSDAALQQQTLAYTKTIARLRAQNNPVLSAARTPQRPAAPKPERFDFSGSFGAYAGDGILEPVRSWTDGPYDYYYLRYWVTYPDGTSETGYVPWPVRYLPRVDPFRLHYPHMPLPGPLPDFVLPPDTNMHPLVAYCFAHHFSSCPIEHA